MRMGSAGEDHEDDRLSWLEKAETAERDENGSGLGGVLVLVGIGLALIAAAIFGWWWLHSSHGAAGSGDLIQAQPGPYKVKPGDTGGMKVAGDGDLRFVTSDGGISNGSVDIGAIPEEPVAGSRAPGPKPSADAGGTRVVAPVPQDAAEVAPRKTAIAPSTAPGRSSGSLVQLGSFPNKSRADSAWKRLSERFAYLAPLSPSVEKAEVNDSTVYRLRVNAGSAPQAKELCGKLKIAGEDCYIP